MSFKVSTTTKIVPIESIIIPRYYSEPKLEKILTHHERFVTSNHLDPIIVDDRMQLLDGYCSLLILQNRGYAQTEVTQVLVTERNGNSGMWLRRNNGEIYCPVCLNVAAVSADPDDVSDVMHGVNFCSFCGSRNKLGTDCPSNASEDDDDADELLEFGILRNPFYKGKTTDKISE